MTNYTPERIERNSTIGPLDEFLQSASLSAGGTYTFNEALVTSEFIDQDNDRLAVINNLLIGGESGITEVPDNFILGRLGSLEIVATATGGEIGSRTFTFSLPNELPTNRFDYGDLYVTDLADNNPSIAQKGFSPIGNTIYVDGNVSNYTPERIERNSTIGPLDEFLQSASLSAGGTYTFNEALVTSEFIDQDNDRLAVINNLLIGGESGITEVPDNFILGRLGSLEIVATATGGEIGSRTFTFSLPNELPTNRFDYGDLYVTDLADNNPSIAQKGFSPIGNTIFINESNGESPTPISVTPPSSSPSPSPVSSPIPSPETTPLPTPDSNQQNDDFTLLSDAGESLTGQSDIKLRMLGGNDFLEVTGGNNYANGNMGEDTMILRGGFGEYLGGKDNDTIEVFGAEEGTSVNGNRGKDFITGNVAGVIYRGGKDNDLLAVSQGDVWGDKGADTFRGVSGDGYAVIQDYTTGEDFVEIETEGSWSNVGDGLMFTDNSGDQLMLLLGINDVEQVSRV